MSETNSPRLAIITGASSGLGVDFARLLAKGGFSLLLVARRQEELAALAAELTQQHGVQVQIAAIDLAQPDAAALVMQAIGAAPIDVLINNAGIGLYGLFAEQPLEDVVSLAQLNVVTLTDLTRRVLPGMIARQRGRILNVASTAAFQPGPTMAAYFASKAYVMHLSEALSDETRGTGVTVTCLCPGPTATEFQSRAEMGGSALFKSRVMDSATVAKIGLDAMFDGQAVVIPGFMNRFLAWATRLPPRSWLPKLARWSMRSS